MKKGSLPLFIDRMRTLWYMQYFESMRGIGIVSRHQEQKFSPGSLHSIPLFAISNPKGGIHV